MARWANCEQSNSLSKNNSMTLLHPCDNIAADGVTDLSITKLLGMRKGYVVALTVTEAVTRVAPREPIPGYKALHKRRVHIFKKNTQCKSIFPVPCPHLPPLNPRPLRTEPERKSTSDRNP